MQSIGDLNENNYELKMKTDDFNVNIERKLRRFAKNVQDVTPDVRKTKDNLMRDGHFVDRVNAPPPKMTNHELYLAHDLFEENPIKNTIYSDIGKKENTDSNLVAEENFTKHIDLDQLAKEIPTANAEIENIGKNALLNLRSHVKIGSALGALASVPIIAGTILGGAGIIAALNRTNKDKEKNGNL